MLIIGNAVVFSRQVPMYFGKDLDRTDIISYFLELFSNIEVQEKVKMTISLFNGVLSLRGECVQISIEKLLQSCMMQLPAINNDLLVYVRSNGREVCAFFRDLCKGSFKVYNKALFNRLGLYKCDK